MDTHMTNPQHTSQIVLKTETLELSRSKLCCLPLYESFMRGEEDEDEEEEDVEEDEEEEEERVMVPEEAWAAARPSRNRELQVTIMAAIIIIMVIILARLEQTLSFQKPKCESEENFLWFSGGLWPTVRLHLAVMPDTPLFSQQVQAFGLVWTQLSFANPKQILLLVVCLR